MYVKKIFICCFLCVFLIHNNIRRYDVKIITGNFITKIEREKRKQISGMNSKHTFNNRKKWWETNTLANENKLKAPEHLFIFLTKK